MQTVSNVTSQAADVDEAVRSSIPLVGHIVREMLGRVPAHISRDELMSAGMLALVVPSRAQGGAAESIAEGLQVSSHAEWQTRRATLRDEWLRILGSPPAPCPLNAQVVSRVEEPDHVRTLVRYNTEPGMLADAYLLTPKNAATSAPAAIGSVRVVIATTAPHSRAPTRIGAPTPDR